MIEFEYEIERDDGDEIILFSPKLYPSPIDSTCYIEGPNSTGKSTLLHLIALGFHGLNDIDIPDSLKTKITDLNEHDKVTFNIKISDTDGNTVLQCKKSNKSNPNIETFHLKNGNLTEITGDHFKRNYKLIYDIPDNPTGRLKDIANDIGTYQSNIENLVNGFRSHIRDITNEINEAKDVNRIEDLKKKNKSIESDIKNSNYHYREDKKQAKLVQMYAYPKLLQEYKGEVTKLKSEIENIVKRSRNKKKKKTTDRSAYTKARSKVGSLLTAMQGNHSETTKLLKVLLTSEDDLALLKHVWLKINFNDIRRTHSFPKTFEDILLDFKEKCSEIYEDNRKVQQTTAVYEQLIGLLKETVDKEIPMPEMENPLSDFISELEKLNSQNKVRATISKNAEEARDLLEGLTHNKFDIEINHFPALIKLEKGLRGKAETPEDDSREGELRMELRKAETKVKNYHNRCAKNDIVEDGHYKLERDNQSEIRQFKHSTENQLLEEIEVLEEKINKSRARVSAFESLLSRNKDTLERLEKKEPHKYESKKKTILSISDHLNNIWKLFGTRYQALLSDYREGKPIPKKSSKPKDHELAKEYYERISLYLGHKLGRIRYIEGEFDVKKVDLAKGTITTAEGKNIRLQQVSTGQSQSAYLLTKMNADYGDKKLIVMFDEVAMMDTKSMKPILGRIKEMQNEGKLLAGLVVQKRNEGPRITPI